VTPALDPVSDYSKGELTYDHRLASVGKKCSVSVGDLFSNAMNQEQGNTVLKVNILRPSKHYFP
jgi:hypothetical protein